MFKVQARFAEGVESFSGKVATDDGAVAVTRAAQALVANYTPDELAGMARLSVRRDDAEDKFRRVKAKAKATGENGAATEPAGNAGIAARQAATRPAKGGKR